MNAAGSARGLRRSRHAQLRLAGGLIAWLSLLWACGQVPPPAASPASPAAVSPARTPAAPPAGSPTGGTSATYPTIDGIPCETTERVAFHIHAHLAIFFNGQPQTVPFGIGIGQPWQIQPSSEGPF